VNGRGERESLELAEKWAKAGEWGWAWHAGKGAKGGTKLVKDAEAAAAKAVAPMDEAFKKEPEEWVPLWLEFWRVHGATNAAQPIVKRYLARRDKQKNDGRRLFEQAVGAMRAGQEAKEFELLERILDEAPCTYEAYYAWKWLSERK
jgi:hypothetical protein